MPRQARIKDDFGFFYIHQIGSDERNLFEKDEDRTYFLEILKRAQSKFQFKLYAYCLLADNEYHLVMDVNGGDLSKIMKSINIGYAMYTKCQGRLFKDRYKSQLLKSQVELDQIIHSVHDNAKQSSYWNSYCNYDTQSPLKMDWLTPLHASDTDLSNIDCTKSDSLSTTCKDCIRSLSEAQIKLDAVALVAEQSLPQLFKDKACRNQLIRDFRRQSTLSLKELGQLFGDLSESTVCKILNHDD